MSGVTGTPGGGAANQYVTTALDKPPDLRGPDVTSAFAELFDAHARQLRGYLAGRPEPDHGHRVASRVDAERQGAVPARAPADLRDEDRDALLLTSWAGLTPAEVAAALGENDSTVRSRLHRVRTRLQALLTEENHDA